MSDLLSQTQAVSPMAATADQPVLVQRLRRQQYTTTVGVLLAAALLSMIDGGAVAGSVTDETASGLAAELFATVSKDTVQVAEPFTFELRVSAPRGTQVAFPAVGDQFGEFEVLEHVDEFDVPLRSVTDQRLWTRRYVLDCISTGDLSLPSVEVQVSGPSGSQTLRSQSLGIRVASVLEGRADPTQFRDIQSVVDVGVPESPAPNRFWWIVTAVGGLAIAGTAAAVFVARRQSWITPRAWAMQEFDAIAAWASSDSGNSEVVLRGLSTVLRDFIEMQFDVAAPLQTTDEFQSRFVGSGVLDSELAERFVRFFTTADQAKFAGLSVSAAELERAIVEARQLVDDACLAATLPSEVPSGKGAS